MRHPRAGGFIQEPDCGASIPAGSDGSGETQSDPTAPAPMFHQLAAAFLVHSHGHVCWDGRSLPPGMGKQLCCLHKEVLGQAQPWRGTRSCHLHPPHPSRPPWGHRSSCQPPPKDHPSQGRFLATTLSPTFLLAQGWGPSCLLEN